MASLVLRNCVRTETIDDPVRPVAEMLKRCNLAQIMEHYKLPAIADAVTFLQALARRLGKLKKGGAPDIVGAARMVLTDFNTGKISYYTVPPKDYKPTVQLESAVVASVRRGQGLAAECRAAGLGFDACCSRFHRLTPCRALFVSPCCPLPPLTVGQGL